MLLKIFVSGRWSGGLKEEAVCAAVTKSGAAHTRGTAIITNSLSIQTGGQTAKLLTN